MVDPSTFESMGCDVVVAGACRSGRAAIERLFHARDQMFSRFKPDSELNRVNAAAGRPVRVSREFAHMLGLALDAAHETGGLVDPTLGAQLASAGYDDDFASLVPGVRPVSAAEPAPRGEVRLDGRLVLAPKGVQLDLNGIVKGKTVDDALLLLDGEGFVSAGGDLAARGTLVAALPRGGSVELIRGGLATSGSDRRRWLHGGTVQHHLIDPNTGVPAASRWEQVTVCGLTCLAADIAAKAAYLLSAEGPDWLDARGLPGRFVTASGEIVANHAWQRMVGAVPCT